MINKITFIIGLVSLFCSINLFSQTISYGYDNNGNRTSRTIYLGNKFLQNSDSTSVTDTVNYVLVDTTNVKDKPIETKIANNKVSIYPNPVKYYLEVEIKEIADSKAEIYISDEFGKTTDKIIVASNRNRIDFSQKASGIYFIKITIDDKSESWKIIKE